MRTVTKVVKGSILFLLFGFGLAFCRKDEMPGNNGGSAPVDYHQSATTQFITAGKTNFAYRVLGNKSGTPLVMVAALGNSMDEWDPALTNALAQRYKVILFDIQGVGATSGATPDNIPEMAHGVVSFINALGYSKVNLLGFSMGSFITQQILLTNPSVVNKAILTGTGPKGAQGLSNLPNILATTVGLTPQEIFLKSFFAPSETSQQAGKLSFERIGKRTINRDAPVSQESATAGLKAVLGWAQPFPDAFKELKTITTPVLVAQGEHDFLVPVINASNLANNIPGARLILYSDGAHGAVYQYHEEFARAAAEFLGK